MTRPRVTATATREAITTTQLCGPSSTGPGVEVSVSFDLHDHDAALAALDSAVREVRAQIEETKEGSQ